MERVAMIDALASPQGLAIAIFLTAIVAGEWRILLGGKFCEIGWKPFAFGLTLVFIGILCLSLGYTRLGFDGRLSTALSEFENMALMFGASIAFYLMSLLMLSVVVLPIAANMLRRNAMTLSVLAKVGASIWLVLTLLTVALPSNEWAELHRFASFVVNQIIVLPIFFFVYLPFMLGVYQATRHRHGLGPLVH